MDAFWYAEARGPGGGFSVLSGPSTDVLGVSDYQSLGNHTEVCSQNVGRGHVNGGNTSGVGATIIEVDQKDGYLQP